MEIPPHHRDPFDRLLLAYEARLQRGGLGSSHPPRSLLPTSPRRRTRSLRSTFSV